MKHGMQKCPVKCLLVILYTAILSAATVQAQICPQPITTTKSSNANTNTYYPGLQATVNAGSTSVTIGAATYGTTPTLINVAGNAVQSRQYRLKRGNNELLLTNLETLPAGIYFMQASDGVSNRNGKLVIQHN